jgi:hypothetical protein
MMSAFISANCLILNVYYPLSALVLPNSLDWQVSIKAFQEPPRFMLTTKAL